MRIEILDEAQQDLIEGCYFYEDREAGIGAYFLDCLFSGIVSLLVFAGIHKIVFGYRRCLSKRFPFAFYIPLSRIWFGYTPSWFAVETRLGLEDG